MVLAMLLIGIALGGAVGAVLGLTGAGGGILALPALMIGMGYSLTDARPISLIAIGLAALLGCMDGGAAWCVIAPHCGSQWRACCAHR
jgi:uncharacterized membrane protein YfcA